MLQIQLYVNQHPEILNRVVADCGALNGSSLDDITWVSPLESNQYREYQDGQFLEMLGINKHKSALTEFWPSGGPCWDALGIARDSNGDETYLLVEAKSYPAEANSTMKAVAQSSIDLIVSSMERAALFFGIHELPSEWRAGRYQAANRLAHLYFLTQVCGLDASLLFLCFTNDPTHSLKRRTALADWQSANERLWFELGLAGQPSGTYVSYLPGLERPSSAKG